MSLCENSLVDETAATDEFAQYGSLWNKVGINRRKMLKEFQQSVCFAELGYTVGHLVKYRFRIAFQYA